MFTCLASDMQLKNNTYTHTHTHTHTHLEGIVVFLLQQWLGERDSLLRYTYIEILCILNVHYSANDSLSR